METRDYLAYVVDQIHRTIVATVDDAGLSVTAAIDMMDYDDNSLYFLTAKGKGFYDRLKKREFLAFTAIKGEDTMSTAAVSIRGKVRELGSERLPRLFEKNPYMKKIYPKDTRNILQVFILDKGEGQFFDISDTSHITRGLIQLGDVKTKPSGYFITSACIQCGKCLQVCPQQCIDCTVAPPAQIDQNRCLHCGQCEPICPVQAIVQR